MEETTIFLWAIEMYTINEVADIFKVSHWTVRKWIDAEKIEAVKTIGGIRISDDEVESLKSGRDVAANCILSPRPKVHPRRKSKGIRPWEE